MSFDPGTLYATIKIAYDIANGINSLNTDVEINLAVSKVIEILRTVQGDALAMQAKHQELLQVKYDLEQKIIKFEEWSNTKNNYDLKHIGAGVPAYLRKDSDASTDNAIWICPYCYGKKEEAFLQLEYYTKDAGFCFCPKCNTPFQWGEIGRGFKKVPRT